MEKQKAIVAIDELQRVFDIQCYGGPEQVEKEKALQLMDQRISDLRVLCDADIIFHSKIDRLKLKRGNYDR